MTKLLLGHRVVGMIDFADAVATKVISAFNGFPNNGKPREEGSAIVEFTVLASIVASRSNLCDQKQLEHDVLLVSLATGTKCAGASREDPNGFVTSDSHAEVLARRGLVRWLSKCVCSLQKCPSLSSDPLFPLHRVEHTSQPISESAESTDSTTSPNPSYALKDDWQFYLYISDSPCGDGSLYPKNIGIGDNNQLVGFTGAKIIRSQINSFQISGENATPASEYTASASVVYDSTPAGEKEKEKEKEKEREEEEIALASIRENGKMTDMCEKEDICNVRENGCCTWEREDIQDLGVVRTKSGRSDIPVQHRTSSMSCSDKICR